LLEGLRSTLEERTVPLDPDTSRVRIGLFYDYGIALAAPESLGAVHLFGLGSATTNAPVVARALYMSNEELVRARTVNSGD
jgi:hypothetical protein